MSLNKKRRLGTSKEIDGDIYRDDDDDIHSSQSVKKKKKRVIVSSDEEDDSVDNKMDNDEILSINEIKKNAKIRAKKLAKNDESDDQQQIPKKTKTTPPSKPANSIMNYFRPVNTKKEIIEPPKDKTDNNLKVDDDGFQFTVLKEKNKISPKSNGKNAKTNETNLQVHEDLKKHLETEAIVDKSSVPTKEKADIKKISSSQTVIKEKNSKIKVKVEESPKKIIEQKVLKESLINDSLAEVASSKSPKKKTIKKIESEALPPIIEPKRVSDLFVDKYKPVNCRQVIGQQGDRSSMNKLIEWLRDWYSNLDSNGSSNHKAALLSGPPGIGKTTTAELVCKELGYDFLELNASDTRSKKLLQENLNQLLGNTKLTNFFRPLDKVNERPNSSINLTSKHCVIMDEVDGMAGNEDRGGVAELIELIKNTKVPIICICNDRSDAKIRSLSNYCLDLRFAKPRADQIKAILMDIVSKEKINISSNVLNDLIVSSNFDIRQCIHNLFMLAASRSSITSMINFEQKPIKDVKLGPFDAIKKVFAVGEEYARMSFNDKSDLFFCDYSIMPLFVYENYLNVSLSGKHPCQQFKQMLKTITSISNGDLIEKEIRTNQTWSLLPLQGAFATVMPGAYMRSTAGLGFPQFPQYMGKISTLGKNNRLLDELMGHMVLSVTGSRSSLSLDYLEPLRSTLINPLVHLDKDDGVSEVLETMENYSLLREDMTTIMELAMWKDDIDPWKKVDTKIKTALTKECKKGFSLPYATDNEAIQVKKSSKKKGKR